MNRNFWKGKKVFLTGHTGFKGSWISLWLASMGARVKGYALEPPTKPSLFEAASVAGELESVIGDIRHREKLKEEIVCFEPEIVFHMAAQPLVRESYITPVETYETNVMGTVHLLDAVRSAPSVRSVVIITTDKCYENNEWVWGYRENEPMGGYDPYSNSKGCAELTTSAYRNSFFHEREYGKSHHTAIASARAGNVIGGGDWAADRLLPDIIRQFTVGEKVLIRSPHSVRPWQHVLEPLSGYLLLAEKLYTDGIDYAEAWNFGPSDLDAQPVEYIVKRMTQLWGEGRDYSIDKGIHPHEASYLKLDCSKARMRLGWEPKWNLDTVLKKIIDWTKEFNNGNDMREISLAQIKEYQEEE